MSKKEIPSQAQVVIVGGGVIGTSVAYHLTKLGWKDVVLLEKKELTSGTTWHAAGLVVTPSGSELGVEMSTYTRELVKSLEAETGQSTGFKDVGYIQLASSPDWLESRRRMAVAARRYGVDYQEISPTEIKKMFPLAHTDDILAGFYVEDDGRANPVDFTMALAKGARMGGTKIFEETKVIGVNQEKGRVTGVVTNKGAIKAEIVVNCAGLWGRELGKLAGVNVPLQAAEHYYLLTQPIDGIHADLPIIEDFERYAYFREEVGGLLVGFFEPIAVPWGVGGIPKNFAFGEIKPDWDRMMPYVEMSMGRIPALKEAGIHKFFCGPESFTPDGKPLLGEAPELKNFFVAAGLNSIGILRGGGVGRIMAQWIVDGYCPVESHDIDIARCQPYQGTQKFLEDRTVGTLGLQYQLIYPNFSKKTARNLRKTAINGQLAKAGAFFTEGMGWEMPDWYAPVGKESKIEKYSWGRQNWFDFQKLEQQAIRETVGMYEMTSYAKIRVKGSDAMDFLQLICANDVDVAAGRMVYTQWLNNKGGIEADVTVTRIDIDDFLIVSGSMCLNRDMHWLKKNMPKGANCSIFDATSSEGCIAIMGPNSRDLLQSITDTDMSNESFPFANVRNIEVGMANVRAHRITYVGELGWELYFPIEFSSYVAELIDSKGEEFSLRQIGMHTVDSCRIEKAYRHFGHDITDEDHVIDAGLGFAVKLEKTPSKFGKFIGFEAVQTKKELGYEMRIMQFLLSNPELMLYHNEPILKNGEIVGHLTSGTYSHTLGGAVGLGYVTCLPNESHEDILSAEYTIEVEGIIEKASVSLKPMYDPLNKKIRN